MSLKEEIINLEEFQKALKELPSEEQEIMKKNFEDLIELFDKNLIQKIKNSI